jgi:hypothetical protein
MKGEWIASCAANFFCMTKPILLKATFVDLKDTLLLCITLWMIFSEDQQPLILRNQKCQIQII